MYTVEIRKLKKSYGSLQVLRDLTLRVSEGEVYGLLGPHGAGKSTLIHLLLGFLKPNAGRLQVLGTTNLAKVRGKLGYLPERLRYHMRYSAGEYLRFLGQLSDLRGSILHKRVEEELHRVGLIEVAHRPLTAFSKGMLQRFGIAQALLADPDLLLIDDPVSGLDSTEQREVFELLSSVRNQGYTMLICSHATDKIEQLCDRVGVLMDGRLVDETEVRHLSMPGKSVVLQVDQLSSDMQLQLMSLSPAVQCYERTITLRPNTQSLQGTVLRKLLDAGVILLSLEQLERPLEQFYLRAVQGTPVDVPNVDPDALVAALSDSGETMGLTNESDPLLNDLLHTRLRDEQ